MPGTCGGGLILYGRLAATVRGQGRSEKLAADVCERHSTLKRPRADEHDDVDVGQLRPLVCIMCEQDKTVKGESHERAETACE